MSARLLEGPKLKYPVEHKSVGHYLFDCCNKFSERICQIDGFTNESETYSSVKLRSIRLALTLQKRGVTSHDVITVCSANTLDSTIPVVATLFLGAKISNLDSSLSTRHITHLINLVSPKFIFAEKVAIKKIEESLTGIKIKPEIIVFGQSDKYEVFKDLLRSHKDEETFNPPEVDPNDDSIMFFSSGTTGLPKAICHSHHSFLHVINNSYQCGWRGVMFHFTTFYWMTGLMIFANSFKDGACRTFCRNASAEDVFRMIQQYKIEFIFMAPILTYKLTSFENASNYDTSSLKFISTGGTPLAESQIIKMNELFKPAPTYLGYGMTEIGLIASFVRPSDIELAKRKLGSTGKLAADMRLKVVDQNNETPLGPNQEGEIRMFSPSLMKGYYKTDSSSVFDKEGFLKTGDVGYFDEDDCIYIVERIKEMFKYQSWHIVPSSIEGVLLEHPSIEEAVVFGVPRGEEGEVPAAAVVVKDGCKLDAEEIHKFLENKVADREKLRGGISFFKNLPMTPTGKVSRRDVRNTVLNAN